MRLTVDALLGALWARQPRCPGCGSERVRLSKTSYDNLLARLFDVRVGRCRECSRHLPLRGSQVRRLPREDDRPRPAAPAIEPSPALPPGLRHSSPREVPPPLPPAEPPPRGEDLLISRPFLAPQKRTPDAPERPAPSVWSWSLPQSGNLGLPPCPLCGVRRVAPSMRGRGRFDWLLGRESFRCQDCRQRFTVVHGLDVLANGAVCCALVFAMATAYVTFKQRSHAAPVTPKIRKAPPGGPPPVLLNEPSSAPPPPAAPASPSTR